MKKQKDLILPVADASGLKLITLHTLKRWFKWAVEGSKDHFTVQNEQILRDDIIKVLKVLDKRYK